MRPQALLVGGTGPTGPLIARGLVERDYEVTLFHRGVHEVDELMDLEHVHGDPHFRETIRDALGERRFDVVVATYGRIMLLAQHFAGRCGQFVSVGGIPVYEGYDAGGLRPRGMAVLTREDGPLVGDDGNDGTARRFARRIREVEELVFELHRSQAFSATHFRYPNIYGPRSLGSRDWSIVRRVLDRRPFVLVPDGGLRIITRCAAANAAHSLLLAVDHPDAAAGEVFNCGDDEQFTAAQWIEMVIDHMDAEVEIRSVASCPSLTGWPIMGAAAEGHALVSTTKIQTRLDYRDVVDPRHALASTVDWLVANPPDLETEQLRPDRFDYDAEDRLAALGSAFAESVAGEGIELCRDKVHLYPHPTAPGTGRDHRGR
jgi:nucleoside-diphosphate-sugar epimerase